MANVIQWYSRPLLPLGRNSGHNGRLTSQVSARPHLKDSFF
jgi:hypothetical protein